MYLLNGLNQAIRQHEDSLSGIAFMIIVFLIIGFIMGLRDKHHKKHPPKSKPLDKSTIFYADEDAKREEIRQYYEDRDNARSNNPKRKY